MSSKSDKEVTLRAAVPISEREQLLQFDEYLERFIEAVREAAEEVDPEQIDRILETTKRLGLRLEESLPPTLDPAVASEIRQILIGGMRKLDELAGQPIDLLDDFLVRAESIRHIVRDALDEDVGAEVDLASKQALALWLAKQLDGVPRRDVAAIVGVDVRTYQRWLAGIGGPVPHRAQTIARLVAVLRTAWTPRGIAAWLKRPRLDLGGAPLELVDDASREPELLEAARRGRAQHGS
jgi:transcriptional regulator with XRE-family HTH domain